MNRPAVAVPARRHNTTPLDRLADAAATSPPAATVVAHTGVTDKRSPTSASDIDPTLTLPAVSFPTFPHDIFNSGSGAGGPVLVTPSKKSEIEWPSPVRERGANGSEAEGLPPKEIIDIMFAPPPLA
jgi:hypothetical protein